MAKPPTFKNVVLCEHVVIGTGNKHSLINVYGGDVLVGEFPAELLFGLYVEFIPDGSMPHDSSLEIRVDGKVVGRALFRIDDVVTGNLGVIALPVFQIALEQEATMEVFAIIGEHKPHSILKKRLERAPGATFSPTASPPPSEQSPTARKRTRKLL